MIRKQVSWWPGNVEVGGTHVHHLVWGICAMMIFGYVGVVHQPDSPWREIVTVLFAIGMGLTLDEFALWVELKDVYWEKEGRKSIDAMIIAGCARRGAARSASAPGSTLADDVEDARLRRRRRRSGWSGSCVALVNAAKEKLVDGAGLAGLLAGRRRSGALRLAKPHSLWARRFYRDGRASAAARELATRPAGRPAAPDVGAGSGPERRLGGRPDLVEDHARARRPPGSPAGRRGCRRAGRRRAPRSTATAGWIWTAFL